MKIILTKVVKKIKMKLTIVVKCLSFKRRSKKIV